MAALRILCSLVSRLVIKATMERLYHLPEMEDRSQVLTSAGAFFLDPEQPIVFQDGDGSFGHQVVQLDKWVIVSAPEAAHKTGRIYRCDPRSGRCTPITITGSGEDSALGLAMAAQENPPLLIVCGPTLKRTCGHNIYVNGRCHLLDVKLRKQGTLPISLPDCPSGPSLDIVFLIDGSGSIGKDNFFIMLDFVSKVISTFNSTDTQFALIQYSFDLKTQFSFKRFPNVSDLSLVRNIRYQSGAATRTATGIRKAIHELFVPQRKSREKSQQLLIVITDGMSNNDSPFTLPNVSSEADKLGIRRISIGVGEILNNKKAYKELRTIASSSDHVLNVTDFSLLGQIEETLQRKIFAIEGHPLAPTPSHSGHVGDSSASPQETLASAHHLQMAAPVRNPTWTRDTVAEFQLLPDGVLTGWVQCDLTPDGPILGAVGAYDWSGGVYVYRSGYSLLQLGEGLVAIGAPRYRHVGKVLIYKNTEWKQKAAAYGELIGSYFGSVLGGVRVSSSHMVLAVGAPTYYSPGGPGGRVYLCPIAIQDVNSSASTEILTLTCPETLQGDGSQPLGHFGSAISVLPDLTGDQFRELAIGAPFEDNQQGAIYIFLGKPGGFQTSYSQRVAARLLSSSLKFFGRSLSGNLDLTEDGLTDLTVGSEGRVFVFRSRAVISVSASMQFSPREIPLYSYDCAQMSGTQVATNITVCFTHKARNLRTPGVSAQMNYTLLLDAGHLLSRALFHQQPDARTTSQSLQLTEGPSCAQHVILLPECVENILSPLRVSLNFSLVGSAVLSEDSRSSHSEEVQFEKNCGGDGVCEDDLKVNVTFPGVTQLVVGESLAINVSVMVRNDGDDSYNARVLIPFPPGLSYRTVFIPKGYKKVTVFCSTMEDQSVVKCEVNRPLLRANTTGNPAQPKNSLRDSFQKDEPSTTSWVVFVVSFHVSPKADLGDTLTLTASVASDNRGSHNNAMTASCQLRILYAIYVTITSLETSSKYENFTGHESTIQHIYKVINLGEQRLPLSVIFLLPVRLGKTPVWEEINISSSQPLITDCTTMGDSARMYRELWRRTVLNCSLGKCMRVECHIRDLKVHSSVIFNISGLVTKDWATQDLKRITLQSSADIVYDSQTFHQNQHFTRAQVRTVLEIPDEYSYIPVMAGSSVGGLLLLGLITATLYKLGFFRRQYKELLENPRRDSEHEAPPGTSTQ